MLRRSFTILILLLAFGASAQNLVLNPSFENYDNCPMTFGQIIYPPSPPSWPQSVTGWFSSCHNSPDYYNSCTSDIYCTVPDNFHGHQPARTGQAYVGLVIYSGNDLNNANGYREYVHSKLSAPLVAGRKYRVSYYVNFPVNDDHPVLHNMMSTNEFGAHLSSTQITQPLSPLSMPHLSLHAAGNTYIKDTLGWTEVTGVYIASGGEEWITIGSFGNGSVPPMQQAFPATPIAGAGYSSYYFVDDVSVEELATCDTLTALHDITSCMLEPYGMALTALHTGSYQWSTGATTKDITVQGPGTYIVVTKNGCDMYTDSFVVKPIPQGPATSNDVPVCNATEGVTLTATAGADSYLWSTGATTQSITVNAFGNYTCSVIKYCELRTETFNVRQQSSPDYIDMGSDVTICKEQPVSIGRQIEGASAYLWNTGSTDCCITPQASGSYTVQVWSGCKVYSDTIDVALQGCENCLLMPTAFTPNADGRNDGFRPIVRCPVKGYAMRIYNRWGELIFVSYDPSESWNGYYRGSRAEMGTYHYYLQFATGGPGGIETIKGDVTMIY